MPQNAVAILFGSLLAYYGNELPDQSWSALAPMLLFLCFCNPVYRFILLAAAAYLWSSAAFHTHLEHRLIETYDQQQTLLRGVIAEIPEIHPGRIKLSLTSPQITDYPGSMPRLVRLNWYQDQMIPQPGEQWQFQVKLKQPRGMLNPGGFDFEAWQFTRGVDASGYIRNSALNYRLKPASWLNLNRWRMHLATAIDKYCSACVHKGLIKALALGFRGDIEHRTKRLLQSTGTAHLLAISGLHIGMVAVLFFALGRCCWKYGLYRTGLNRAQTASLLAIFAAIVYAGLAGFSLPTVRALLMLIIVLCALLIKNRINLLQSLSLAVIVMLVVDSRVVGSASFWLSVSALLLIALVQFRLPGRMPWWQQLLALQCCFSLLFAPLGILIFDQVNPASFAANIIAIPGISFAVLPVVLLVSLMASLGLEAALPLFTAADKLLELLLTYLELLLNSGLESVITAALPVPLTILLMASILVFLMPRIAAFQIIALIAITIFACWQPARLEQGDFELVVFDVGMGTSVLLRTRHHSLVYDFGPGKANGYSSAEWALLPAIQHNDIETPDLLVVSHADQDHSGGLHALQRQFQSVQLLSGTPGELRSRLLLEHRVGSCHGYPDWRWDGVDFRFLSVASTALPVSTNNRSCVLLIVGNHRVLLPGDIEVSRESSLALTHGSALEADVLLAPHHGSATSSSWSFINQVKPEYVVYTLSRGNRWGFPKPAVVARYDALGIRQLRSDRDGAITVTSKLDGLTVKAIRVPLKRIWRRW